MSLKHMIFELTPEQLESRKNLTNDLLARPEIQTFQKKYDCPDSIIELYASRFMRWIKEKSVVTSLSENEIRNNPDKGSYIDLVYDPETGILDEVFKEVDYVGELAKDRAYLSRYKIFDLPLSLEAAHFEQLDLTNEGTNFLKIAQELRSFNETGYYLYGNMGVGKSFLAACVTNLHAKNDKNVAFVHVPTLMNHLKQLFNRPEEMQSALNTLCRIPLLVLDDLGAEPITSWSRDEILLTVLNDRLENKRKTIITSNYIPKDLVQLYQLDNRGTSDAIRSTRLVERITALTSAYEMTGKNRRKA